MLKSSLKYMVEHLARGYDDEEYEYPVAEIAKHDKELARLYEARNAARDALQAYARSRLESTHPRPRPPPRLEAKKIDLKCFSEMLKKVHANHERAAELMATTRVFIQDRDLSPEEQAGLKAMPLGTLRVASPDVCAVPGCRLYRDPVGGNYCAYHGEE